MESAPAQEAYFQVHYMELARLGESLDVSHGMDTFPHRGGLHGMGNGCDILHTGTAADEYSHPASFHIL